MEYYFGTGNSENRIFSNSNLIKNKFQIKSFIFSMLVLLAAFLFYLFYSHPTLDPDFDNCLMENSWIDCRVFFWTYNLYNNGVFGPCLTSEIKIHNMSHENHRILLNFYLVSPEGEFTLDQDYVKLLLKNLNNIWGVYGLEFESNEIKKISVESNMLRMENISKTNGDTRLVNLVIDKNYMNESQKIPHIIISNFETCFPEFLEKCVRTKVNDEWGYSPDEVGGQKVNIAYVNNWGNVSWVVSHEIGHILNNNDKAYFVREYNLMTHGGCIRDNFHPIYLDSEQIEKSIAVMRNIEIK